MQITVTDITHNELTRVVDAANAELFNEELSVELIGGASNYLIRSADAKGKGWTIAQVDANNLVSMVARRYILRIRSAYDERAVAALIRALSIICREA